MPTRVCASIAIKLLLSSRSLTTGRIRSSVLDFLIGRSCLCPLSAAKMPSKVGLSPFSPSPIVLSLLDPSTLPGLITFIPSHHEHDNPLRYAPYIPLKLCSLMRSRRRAIDRPLRICSEPALADPRLGRERYWCVFALQSATLLIPRIIQMHP